MFLMSTSMIVCDNLIFLNRSAPRKPLYLLNSSRILVQLACGRRRLGGLIPNAKKGHSRKRSWWKKFFFDEEGNWFGLKDEDMTAEEGSSDDELSDGEKFEAWRRRAGAIVELREAQEDMKNEENRRWEDWIVDQTNSSSWVQDQNDGIGHSSDDFREDLAEMIPGGGLAKSLGNFVLGREDDDLLYEDRVFQYASFNSVSPLALHSNSARI